MIRIPESEGVFDLRLGIHILIIYIIMILGLF